jgi:glycerol-3-phosphate O-acyltransferase / dihydroxyacetone phosphate acyltransferase
MVVELNRRLVKGYTRYKDDPRIIRLKKSVLDYNRRLLALNIRDHQVEYAKLALIKVLATLIYRLTKLCLLSIGTLPGLVLFSPVFIAGKLISIKKAKEALAASTVKIQARDVMATWKLLVGMALAPTLYTFYNILLAFWTYHNRIQGYVPEFVPLWAVFVFGYILFPTITYAALRFGEIGMDIFKSLWPLILALSPQQSNVLVRLRQRRSKLAAEVTDLINTLGPEMFPDFEHTRIIHDLSTEQNGPRIPRKTHQREDSISEHIMSSEPTTPTSPSFTNVNIGGRPSANGHLPRNESFKNLSNIGLFASRPGTPHHIRSRSRTNSTGGFPIQGFSSLDTTEGFDEVTKKIRGAMRERSQRRKSESEKADWESGSSTPTSEGPEGMGMTSVKEGKKDA